MGAVTNTFVIRKAPAAIVLSDLQQNYDGKVKTPAAVTTPLGLHVNFTYNGNANPPTEPGSYSVVGSIAENNYEDDLSPFTAGIQVESTSDGTDTTLSRTCGTP